MNNNRYLIITLAILASLISEATGKEITVASNGRPIEGVTLSVIELPDSIIKFVGISDGNGRIDIPDSLYNRNQCKRIYLNYLGFMSNFPMSHIGANDTIGLKENGRSLKEIIVKGYKPSLRREAGKFIYDPSQLKRESANSFEVLKYTPLVTTSDAGVSILGKGNSKIFINGRNPLMSQSSVVEMLKATPPSQIKRIEIITEPGSSYSASFSGGIVNVILSQPDQGYIGNVSARIKYEASRFSPTISLWNGYSMGKFNASLNLAYSGVSLNEQQTIDYVYVEAGKNISNHSRIHGWSDYISGSINATYDVTSKSVIGVAVSVSASQESEKSQIESKNLAFGEDKTVTSKINSNSPFTRPVYGVRSFYELSFGNNHKIDLSADFYSTVSKSENEYLFEDGRQLQDIDLDSRGVHGKAQMSLNISEKQWLQFGYDFFRSDIDNSSIWNDIDNRFRYKEMINSGFVQLRSGWSDMFSSYVGFRMEAAETDGIQKSSAEDFSDSRIDFFPTAGININIPSGYQNLSIDFGRRISRPFYDFMNPFKIWTSENSYSTGNPDLKPQYMWDGSLYYSFLKSFVLGGSFRYWNDCMTEYTYLKGENVVSSYINEGDEKQVYLFLSYNKLVGNILRIKAETNLYISHRNAVIDNADLGYKSIDWSLFVRNYIMLSQKHRFKMSLAYRLSAPAKMVTKYGKWKNLLDVGFTKIFNNGVTLTLEAYNILGFKNDYHFRDSKFGYDEKTKYSSRSVTVTVSYYFGKKQVSGAEDNSGTALEQRYNKL